MDRYLAGSVLWPQDWTKLRVYFVPRLAEIKPLVDVYRTVLRQFDFVSPMDDQWLHETVAVVQDRPTRCVTATDMSNLWFGLRERIGALHPFTVTAGGALATRHGVMLDLVPDREFARLQQQTRSVVAEVFGPEADRYDGGRPHIALAYGTGPGDSALIQGNLRNATDLRARLTVDAVRLLDVTQDRVRHEVRWRELAVLPLTGGTRW